MSISYCDLDTKCSLSFAPAADEMDSPTLRQQWSELLDASDNVDLAYQSPEWLDHLIANGDDVWLAIARDGQENIIGVVPVVHEKHPLEFTISGRPLFTSALDAVTILGNDPLLPRNPDLYARLIDLIWTKLPACKCIHLEALRTDSLLWKYLESSPQVHAGSLVYLPFGKREYNYLRLPPTYDDFLSKFSRRSRETLRWRVKVFRERVGPLHLDRIESPSEVPGFLDSAKSIARRSWQGSRLSVSHGAEPRLVDLAKRGMLRAYLLKCDGIPCALEFSYQCRGVFYCIEQAYDRAYARWSPGTVLQFMIIEDLCAHRRPKISNFGIGDPGYKKRLCNEYHQGVTALLLKKTWPNRMRQMAHGSFRSTVARLKRVVRTHSPETKRRSNPK